MSEPVLNEDVIMQLLSQPVTGSPTNVEMLQQGIAQALADLYDRGVTRDEFISGAALCLGTYAQTSKLWLLENIRSVHDEGGGLDTAKFDYARDGIISIIRNQLVQVKALVTRLMECPGKGDKVH